MVANTSELLPEPETPVNTVSRRLGMSREMSARLFSLAPRTWITSWRSAACRRGLSGVMVILVLCADEGPIISRACDLGGPP
jgi:hypothetical protein